MKILIDATEITPSRVQSSIPIYIIRYLSSIDIKERKNYILLINSCSNEYFKNNFPDYKTIPYKFCGWNKYWLTNPIYLYSLYKFNKLLKRFKIDVIFTPTDYPYYLQNKFCCKKVIVIHDLKGIKRNCNTIRECIEAYILNKMYKRHIETANNIIAISKYTKQDILTFYPNINEEKIHVVYNSIKLSETVKKPINLKEGKFILYVNTLHRYKNILTLIKAYAIVSNEIEHKLIIVGKRTQYWENNIIPYINKNKLNSQIIQLQDLSNEELRYLYEKASLFVTPSLNEGFGYTPIEAAICNCPVISSLQEALPDSTQGLLNYYYPAMDYNALSDKIKFLLKNSPSKNELNKIAQFYKTEYSLFNQEKKIREILLKNSDN